MAIMAATVLMAGTSRADFKYTQQSKVTGGTLASVTKSLGVFSKSARQATAPQTTTTSIHGNRLRTEDSNGMIEIIDLDGRRFIHIDTTKKTYTIQTFEQLKQQIAQAQTKMKDEQAKTVAKHDDPQTMTMVPKFDMQATGATHPVLDIPAKEMKMRVDLLFKSTDPKTEADLEKSNMSTWMTSDSWYGTVPGYEELRAFYMKMAKELNWLPGSMGMANPQMARRWMSSRKMPSRWTACRCCNTPASAWRQTDRGRSRTSPRNKRRRHRTTTAHPPARPAQSPRDWGGSLRKRNSSRLTTAPRRTRGIQTIRHLRRQWPVR
jgi:hypothetical protein